jgi:hypothetical protein
VLVRCGGGDEGEALADAALSDLKKIEKAMKDGKTVKIAKIQNLDLETVPNRRNWE